MYDNEINHFWEEGEGQYSIFVMSSGDQKTQPHIQQLPVLGSKM